MKNLSLLFMTFLFLQYTLFAQNGWFQQTSGTTTNLLSVHFVDENIGWAVGENGKILQVSYKVKPLDTVPKAKEAIS